MHFLTVLWEGFPYDLIMSFKALVRALPNEELFGKSNLPISPVLIQREIDHKNTSAFVLLTRK